MKTLDDVIRDIEADPVRSARVAALRAEMQRVLDSQDEVPLEERESQPLAVAH